MSATSAGRNPAQVRLWFLCDSTTGGTKGAQTNWLGDHLRSNIFLVIILFSAASTTGNLKVSATSVKPEPNASRELVFYFRSNIFLVIFLSPATN